MNFTFSQNIVRRLRHMMLLANFVENIQKGRDNSFGSDLEGAENRYQFLRKFEKLERIYYVHTDDQGNKDLAFRMVVYETP
jgi:hypothetical protein